jgi:hypothetical protein
MRWRKGACVATARDFDFARETDVWAALASAKELPDKQFSRRPKRIFSKGKRFLRDSEKLCAIVLWTAYFFRTEV